MTVEVDDDAEIDRSDRKQVGGFSPQHRDDDGQQQCYRDGRRYDYRAAQIAEEKPLDQEDQRDAEEHIMQHRTHRDGDEVAAVIERFDLHAARQAAVAVNLLDRRAHAGHDIHGPFELLHQDDAEDDVGLVVTSGDAEPRRVSDLHLGHVREQHRHARLLRHHDVANILKRPHDAEAAYVDRLLADRDGTTAHIGVAVRDRGHDLRQRQAVGHHLVEVDLGLEFLGFAAEHGDVGHAGHDPQLALDHPVLQRLQLDQIHVGRTFELISEDFADAAGG